MPIAGRRPRQSKSSKFNRPCFEQLESRRLLAVSPGMVPVGVQPAGNLAGKIVYTTPGHGWNWSSVLGRWATDRGENNDMVEDFGTHDQATYYVDYLFRAGATIVPMRPVGRQLNEVVLDNDLASVTYTGTWSNSTGSRYYDEDYDSVDDAVHYRYASTAASETATARYTPAIPAAGMYPVYTWVSTGTDRTSQLYKVNHTGGQTQVRVDHSLVGRGWVYLGTYHFNSGSDATNGSVVISNQGATSKVVIADAIRFGNGMGDLPWNNTGPGSGSVSGFPREDEHSYAWVYRGKGIGAPSSITSDPDNPFTSTAKMAAEMNAAPYGTAMYMGIHSNAANGTARGAVGLWSTSSSTPHQDELALYTARQIDTDMRGLGFDWVTRSYTSGGAFGELNNAYYVGEMDAIIIEVAFHDTPADAAVMKDPAARDAIGRAMYEGSLEYFDNWGGLATPAPLPSQVTNARVVSNSSGQVTLNWTAGPTSSSYTGPNGAAATGYRVYVSSDGLGFDGGTLVAGVGTTTATLTGLDPAIPYYFKVVAVNAGGESKATEVLTALPSGGTKEVLIVSGFDRNDAAQDNAYAYSGTTVSRVWQRWNNSFDYLVRTAAAIHAAAPGTHVASTSNEAVIAGSVNLNDYDTVIWVLGNESTDDDTFNATEQTKVINFINAGGNLFLSGSEIAWDLDQQNNGRTFFETNLKGNYVNDDAGTFTATADAGGIFAGLASSVFASSSTFSSLDTQVYSVTTPDVIAPQAGAISALTYSGGTGGSAAIQVAATGGKGAIVMFGFPFETMTSETRRTQVMGRILDYFGVGLDPSATPGTPDLVAAFDTGSPPPLDSDNITNRDNNSGAKTLQFVVPGTVVGALVKIYYNGTEIGSATATGTSTTITTTGALDIPDGAGRLITARQTETGKDMSADSPSLSLTIDTAVPTADIVDVSPDPRLNSVSSITINFSRAVTGFDLADLSLTRDGGANLLTGSQTLTTGNNIAFSLNNLDTITNVPGAYVLTLTASGSGIVDALAANAFAANASDAWTNNNAAPTIGSMTDIPDPIAVSGTLGLIANTVADSNGGTLTVNFYRESNSIAGLQVGGDTLVATDSSSPYAVQFTAPATPATYTYYAQVTDAQGLTSNVVSTTNTVVSSITATPGTPDLRPVTDSGSPPPLDADNITNFDNSSLPKRLEFDVPGTVSGATVTIYADGVAIGSAVASGTTTTVLTDGAIDLADGARSITARQVLPGETQSPDSAALSVTIDTAAPVAEIIDVSPDPRINSVSSIAVTFTRAVTGVDIADFSLTRDGGANLLTGSQTVTTGDNVNFSVNNLAALTNVPGAYVLTLTASGSGITDALAGNALVSDASDAWTNNNAAPTIGSLTDIPDPVASGGLLGLIANTVADLNGGTLTVNFYRESNGTAGLQVGGDTLVGTDTSNPYAVQVVAPVAAGTYTYYAQVTDAQGLSSGVVSATNDVTGGAVSATPGAPDLLAATDSGSPPFDADDRTKFDNSSLPKALQFQVSGTVSGATVTIYADGIPVGSAVASGATTTVTTDGALDLADGGHSITARQTESGKAESPDSIALPVTIDSAAPVADVIDVSPDPRTSGVSSITISFDQVVGGLDIADLSLTRNGGPNLLTGAQTITTGDNVTFSVNNLASLTSVSGTYVLTLTAAGSGVADVEANALAADASDTWVHGLPSWLAPLSVAEWNSSTNVLTVSGATTIVADPAGDLPVINASGAAAVLTIDPDSDQRVHVGALHLSNGASATLTSVDGPRTAANHRVLVVDDANLSIDASSMLDLADNDLVLDYDNPGDVDALTTLVHDLLGVGYNLGTAGLLSSVALLDPSTYALGYGDNASLPSPYGSLLGGPSFAGEDVDDTAFLVKFTYAGDLNLDGLIDFGDLSTFNTSYDNGTSSNRRWFEGDFNYDGFIDFQDLSVFNTNYDPNKPHL